MRLSGRPITSLLAAAALVSLSSAAVLPSSSKSTSKSRSKGSKLSDEWCKPWFSGLVQTVRKTNQAEIVWKAVATEKGQWDGVRVVDLTTNDEIVPMDPDIEWFVTPTTDGLFEISSGAGSIHCDSHDSSFYPPSDDSLGPEFSTINACSPPHIFSIVCSSCDRYSDSASGCLLHSRSKDKCIELSEEGKLKWGECSDLMAMNKRKWIGKEERDTRRSRQTWDITP